MNLLVYLGAVLAVGLLAPPAYDGARAMLSAIGQIWATLSGPQAALLAAMLGAILGIPSLVVPPLLNARASRAMHLAEIRRQRAAYRSALLAEVLAIEEFLASQTARLRHNLKETMQSNAWGQNGLDLFKESFRIPDVSTPIFDSMSSNFGVLDGDIPAVAIRPHRELRSFLSYDSSLWLDAYLTDKDRAVRFAQSLIDRIEEIRAMFEWLIRALSKTEHLRDN